MQSAVPLSLLQRRLSSLRKSPGNRKLSNEHNAYQITQVIGNKPFNIAMINIVVINENHSFSIYIKLTTDDKGNNMGENIV